MCCYPSHHDEIDSQPATLRTLRPTSAASIALPASAVPHGAPNGVTDAQALREIFSSSSSVRGYQAAVGPSDFLGARSTSFDAEFQMPIRGSSSKKPSGRLELLGHHIRQKLSETRLSKSSSKPSMKDDAEASRHIPSISELKPDEPAHPLGMSHPSTGLSDILRSRNVSQGGYDSDAKSIETALLRSNAGTLRFSPNDMRQLLDINDGSNDDSAMATKEETPPRSASGELQSSARRRTRSSSTPNPKTTAKVTFTEALLAESKDSPGALLRRLSAAIADGTIRPPDTPELRALRLPSLEVFEQDWSLPPPPPRTASSLDRPGQDAQHVLQALKEKLHNVKRESVASNDNGEKHVSLVSDLDPTFVQYIDDYTSPELVEELSRPSLTCLKSQDDPVYSSQQLSGPEALQSGLTTDDNEDRGLTDYVGTSARNSTLSLPKSTMETMKSESEKSSLHLYKMRISQRLASTSVMPVLSPSCSNVGSVASKSIVSEVSQKPLSFSRYPSWVVQEHNRKPSDPQTRHLFEDSTQAKDSPQWQTITSVDSRTFSDERPRTLGDDASSFYLSDSGPPVILPRPSLNAQRRNSIKNPNSIAIGGRSASGGLPHGYPSMGQISNAEENAWLCGKQPPLRRESEDTASWRGDIQAETRGRSLSMPKTSRFSEELGTPTPKGRRLVPPELTDHNEAMSEVSLNELKNRRNLAGSETSAHILVDRKREAMSEIEIDPIFLQRAGRGESDNQQRTRTWLSQAKMPDWGADTMCQIPERDRTVSRDSIQNMQVRESATKMWGRALRRLREDENHEKAGKQQGLLNLPPSHFDRHGRRRSRSGSSLGLFPEGENAVSATRNSSGEERLQSSLVVTTAPSTRKKTNKAILGAQADGRARSETLREGKARKRSLAELRRFTTVAAFSSPNARNGKTTPKDFLSVWTKYPTHNREDRNAPAGDSDDVICKDFQQQAEPGTAQGQTEERSKSMMSLLGLLGRTSMRSSVDLGLHTPNSWRIMSLRGSKRKSRSMMFGSPASSEGPNPVRATVSLPKKSHKNGFLTNIKRLYRSSSSDLKNYASTYGHRGSVRLGDQLEYPELELLSGEGLLGSAFVKRMEEADAQRRNAFIAPETVESAGSPVVDTTTTEDSEYVDAREHVEATGELDDDGDEELPRPPMITECGIGGELGKKGSCEDIGAGIGGIDGMKDR